MEDKERLHREMMKTMPLPILDSAPSGKPHDYQFMKIQSAKGTTLSFPLTWKNPHIKNICQRDQQDRGTCVGQSTAYCMDLNYINLTKDLPTPSDIECFKKNVIDSLGTTHDILYPQSFSAESAYQMSRSIGNVTYPAGSEIRFAVRALKEYGINLETQWHTDKTGTMVWAFPPGTRKTGDGGITPEDAKSFAANHKIEGYAMCGSPDGSATLDEIKYAIFTKGFVLGAIPVYENYGEMAGGDGSFPEPSGEISGYHALCFYGYDEDHLYLIHSWGDWCGRFGSISNNYFTRSMDMCSWMVILDTSEVKIAREANATIDIKANTVAQITVDGVVIGNTPLSIATEIDKQYTIMASADGFEPQTKIVAGGVTPIEFTLVESTVPTPVDPPKKQSLVSLVWETFISLLRRLFKW